MTAVLEIPTEEEIDFMIEQLDRVPDVLCSIAAQSTPQGACACCFPGNLTDTAIDC